MAVRRLRDKTRWAQGGNGLCVCLDVRVGFDLANRLYKPIKWDLVSRVDVLGHLVGCFLKGARCSKRLHYFLKI